MNGHDRPDANPPPAPRLEPSFIGYDPFDEFTKEVADWISRLIKGEDNVEVEARVGLLVDKDTNERVRLPVMVETILAPDFERVRFESNMTLNQHKGFNELLNKRVSAVPDPNNPMFIKYEHTKTVDEFYDGRIRVSRDEKTGDVIEQVRKTRLGTLDVYSPRNRFDWRISVNKELPAGDVPSGAKLDHSRRKDRVSYSHQACRVDLTQVFPWPATKSQNVSHELEIEFVNPAALCREASRRDRGEPNVYDEMVQVLLNNMRILVRSAPPS